MAVQKAIITKQGYEELLRKKDELDKLKDKNLKDIAEYRSQGDLSENADYQAAREEQKRLNALSNEIEAAINNSVVESDEDGNFGKIVTIKFDEDNIEDGESEVETFRLVGSVETDPLNGKVSIESPIGKALLHASVGDKVYVRTEHSEFYVSVLKIEKADD